VPGAAGAKEPSGRPAGVAFAVALLALLSMASISRWPLVEEGLWRDEAITAFIAQSPSLEVFLHRNRISDYNPPLLCALVASWGRVFGFEERSLKVLALLFGLAAIVAVALLARKLAGNLAGFAAAFYAANNGLLIDHSGDLRPYSLSVSLAVIALAIVVDLRRSENDPKFRRRALALGLCLTLLVYTHIAGVLAAMIIGVFGVAMWATGRNRRAGRALTVAAAAAGVAFLPWLPIAWEQSRQGIPWELSSTLGARLYFIVTRREDLLPVGGLLGVAGFAALGLALSHMWDRARERARALSVEAAPVFASAILVPLLFALYSSGRRYLAIPSALAAVLVGCLIGLSWEHARKKEVLVRFVTLAAIGAVFLGTFVARIPTYRALDASEGISKSGIRDFCRSGPPPNLVLIAPDYLGPTVRYYCGPAITLRGFVEWSDPALFDPRRYAVLWRDPEVVARTVNQLQQAVDSSPDASFVLLSDASDRRPPLFYGSRVEQLRAALEARYTASNATTYRGRIESVQQAVFSRRESSESAALGSER